MNILLIQPYILKELIMAKKKTYVFNEKTISNIEKLKNLTNKKETQIISEAVAVYLEYIERDKRFNDKLEFMVKEIENLSYRLGVCEEKIKKGS